MSEPFDQARETTHLVGGGLKIVSARADILDVEKLDDGERSRFWELIVLRIKAMIADQQNRMESAQTHPELCRHQGQIRALRQVLGIPANLRSAAKERDRTKKQRA